MGLVVRICAIKMSGGGREKKLTSGGTEQGFAVAENLPISISLLDVVGIRRKHLQITSAVKQGI